MMLCRLVARRRYVWKWQTPHGAVNAPGRKRARRPTCPVDGLTLATTSRAKGKRDRRGFQGSSYKTVRPRADRRAGPTR